MKLSFLVDFLNGLDHYSVPAFHASARRDIDDLIHKVSNHPEVKLPKFSQELMNRALMLDRDYEQFNTTLGSLRQHVIGLIEDMKPDYYRESLRLWQHEMPHETTDYILNRALRIDTDARDLILGRVLRYTDWRYPGICFRPGLEDWIDRLVPLDPLYLVDQRLDLLAPAKQRFHPQYQNRLRIYVTPEQIGQPFLDSLPNDQFGYVFAYNYFNYKPIEVIEQYLSELWAKLRPGGVVFFTFNDCDYAHGVGLAERSYQLYTPGSKILHHAQEIGYGVLHRYQGSKDVSWLELHKPGKTRTMRAGQTLAKIVARPK